MVILALFIHYPSPLLLEFIDMYENMIQGPLPTALYKLTKLCTYFCLLVFDVLSLESQHWSILVFLL